MNWTEFCEEIENYYIDHKFSDRQVWAKLVNTVDLDQTAPNQGLHCLPFRLHLSDPYSMVKLNCTNFMITSTFSAHLSQRLTGVLIG